MALSDYNDDPSANTNIGGINIAENCPAGNVNNAIRQLMADLAAGTSTVGLQVMAAADASAARFALVAANASAGANALADITPAADKLAYYTGASTAGITDFPAFARSLVGASSAAAASALIGVLGASQSWQGVSRTYSTNYQNTTGRAIQIAADYVPAGGGIYFQVSADGADWLNVAVNNGHNSVNVIIPNGHYYRIDGVATVLNWAELR